MACSILIVEDDADFREALAEAMRDTGAEVVLAADGLDALDRLRGGPRPVAILLDLGLPRLGGKEFLDRLRADPRYEDLPVITMTGGVGHLEDDGIVARLAKPMEIDDLRRIVESLIDAAA